MRIRRHISPLYLSFPLILVAALALARYSYVTAERSAVKGEVALLDSIRVLVDQTQLRVDNFIIDSDRELFNLVDLGHLENFARRWNEIVRLSQAMEAAMVLDESLQIVKGGYLIPGYDATKYPAQQTNWAGGKASFLMNGSWVTAEVSKQIPATWKFGFFLPPGATQPDSMTFGFALTRNAKNVSQAEQFMAYFLQKKTLSGISTDAGNITPRPDIPAPAELSDVQMTLAAPTLRLTFDGVAGDYSTKVWKQNFLDFWHGKTDAAGFVAKMKSDQVAFWKTQS